jgi:non-ribosomal peptide synthetase component F
MAVESSDKSLTFDQLEDFSTALARDLRDRIGYTYTNNNYDGDNIIAIIVPNTERAIVLIMAILKTGAAYLPLDEDYPEALLLSVNIP